MKTRTKSFKRRLVLVALLFTVAATATLVEQTPGVPNIFSPLESAFQQQTHFLVFTGSDVAGENATTATAYYNAIDPSQSKRNFTQWLKNAGFISDESQWHSTGPQLVACNLPGCDLPEFQPDGSRTYGDNIINADAHAIVLNAADLGFVRNQYIRCIPSCSATNPKIYTYLENYPVNPFSNSFTGGSGFPAKTGYPTQGEAAAAIASALTRPQGDLPGCDPNQTDTALKCSIQRIADVAFEWASPPSNPASSTRYGQLYAFIFSTASGTPTETIAFPGAAGVTPNLASGTLQPFNTGDPFPPNLDFLGNKQHPGVCFICHGGNPKNLTSTGTYPNQGNVPGFRLLPLDIRNLLFSSDEGFEQPASPVTQTYTSRAQQETAIKLYNLAVLRTIPTTITNGRVAHVREVITGWYTDPGGPTYGRTTQDVDFVPVGWREPVNGGTAPAGSEHLYETVIAPTCRSCHSNREVSLDLGTAANFASYKSDVLQYVLQPLCKSGNPRPGAKAMPLAHLTYQRFWQANQTPQVLPYPNSAEHPSLTLYNTAEQVAQYFGYSGTAAYCAVSH
jgi:hypothetical protein